MEGLIVNNLIEINRNLEKLIKVLENKTPVADTTDVTVQLVGEKIVKTLGEYRNSQKAN